MNDDRRLRDRFQALRAEEADEAPDFEHLLARGRASREERTRSRLWLPAAGAAALVAVLLLRPEPEPQPIAFEPGRWATPTDVLLDLPGDELLFDVPDFGRATLLPFDVPSTSPTRRNER